MPLARSRVSERDRRFIIGKSGGRCNNCRIDLFVENKFSEQARIGDDAHIWAYSDGGPRGSAAMVPSDRNSPENLILLCKNCHALVDQQEKEFTADVLIRMRENHYGWVSSCLSQIPTIKPLFHYALYLNVPRIDVYAVINSILLPNFNLEGVERFLDLGMNAGRLMAAYTKIFNVEDLYAYPVSKHRPLVIPAIGQYIFLENTDFRTVSIDKEKNLIAAWAAERSVIYACVSDWKIVGFIDPRWITTWTALCSLRSGRVALSGVLHVSRIDPDARKIYASPLFLAQ